MLVSLQASKTHLGSLHFFFFFFKQDAPNARQGKEQRAVWTWGASMTFYAGW